MASPGRRSIEASLYPASVPYLFFVADTTMSGAMVADEFSATLNVIAPNVAGSMMTTAAGRVDYAWLMSARAKPAASARRRCSPRYPWRARGCPWA